MFDLEIKVKSGTGRYFDPDGCDLFVGNIKLPCVPRQGESIAISTEKNGYQNYLVKEIEYIYLNDENYWIWVYVIPID